MAKTVAKSATNTSKRIQKAKEAKGKVTKAIHDWLAANGRLGGLATNAKRAKLV